MVDHSEDVERAHWRMLVHGMLRAGLGVQDISVRLHRMKQPWWGESSIRDEIKNLRSSGKLLDVLHLKKMPDAEVRSVPSDEDHQEHGPTEEGDPV